jgi:hypothetical protein
MDDRRRISRPSPSMVVALVALFVAIGLGTAWAIERNSVKSKHIKDNAIKGVDVGDDQLTGDDVKESTLSLTGGGAGAGGSGAQGAQGPPGERGPQGEQGPQGPAGSARAYGLVSDIGSMTRTKNVVNVSNPAVPPGVFCVTLDPSIDPATAVMIVAPDKAFSATDAFAVENMSVVEWDSTNEICAAGEFEVETFVYFGDELDNNGGGGDVIGDQLEPEDEGFAFMVP